MSWHLNSKIGVRTLSETVRADAREGDIGKQLGEIAKANPGVGIGSYPFFDPQHGPTRMWCCAPVMHRSSRRPNVRSRRCWSECGEHNQIAREPRSRRKQVFESPRERQSSQALVSNADHLLLHFSNFSPKAALS